MAIIPRDELRRIHTEAFLEPPTETQLDALDAYWNGPGFAAYESSWTSAYARYKTLMDALLKGPQAREPLITSPVLPSTSTA